VTPGDRDGMLRPMNAHLPSAATRRLVWLAVLGIAVLAYLPGLSALYLLDDAHNLGPVFAFVAGERGASSVIFGNTSGMLGRWVSMASFVANAALTGDSVVGLKAGNLLLHLAAGTLLFALLRRLLAREPRLSPHADAVAVALAAVWLLHPAQVAGVLYTVQRMAVLAGLFAIAALLAFVVGRRWFERGRRSGIALLFVAFPLLVALGTFAKENAAVTPLLAGVLEWTLFRPAGGRRPRAVRAFFLLFLGVPALLAVIALIGWPQRLLDYSGRDFTLHQRLLTEARVLWDYVALLLAPGGWRLSVFGDDYPLSTGWLHPWTTAAAVLAWGATLALAVAIRRSQPMIAAGILFFVAGHAVESGVFPLEIYFVHRNYLPSIGLVLVLGGLLALAMPAFVPTRHPLRLRALLVAVPLLLAAATAVQASFWRNPDRFWAREAQLHPQSNRVRGHLLARAWEAKRFDDAFALLPAMTAHAKARDRMQPPLLEALTYCLANSPIPADVIAKMQANTDAPISLYAGIAWRQLAVHVEGGDCPAVDAAPLSDLGAEWLNRTPTRNAYARWQARFYLGLLLAAQNRLAEAEREVRAAWEESSHAPLVGVLLYQLNASLDRRDACAAILADLKQHAGKGDAYVDRAVTSFSNATP